MDKTALVAADVDLGRTIVQALERRGIPIDLAAWVQDERLDWQLVVSSPTMIAQGMAPVIEAIQEVLVELNVEHLEFDDVTAWSPSDAVVKDLKNRVRTGDALQAINLRDLDLGPKSFRSALVYRSHGGRSAGRWLEMDAHVRARSTGKHGVVRGRDETSQGVRYLVRHLLALKDRLAKNGKSPPPDEQMYSEDDLEFLYAIRPGGWPNKPPLMARTA